MVGRIGALGEVIITINKIRNFPFNVSIIGIVERVSEDLRLVDMGECGFVVCWGTLVVVVMVKVKVVLVMIIDWRELVVVVMVIIQVVLVIVLAYPLVLGQYCHREVLGIRGSSKEGRWVRGHWDRW